SAERALQHFKKLQPILMRTLSDEPALVTAEYLRIKDESGPSAANSAARILKACYAHARKETRGLPPDAPTTSIPWHDEKKHAHKPAMKFKDLAAWEADRLTIENPIQRELKLFLLLTGLRRRDAACARWDQIERGVLHRPGKTTKGGRAFDVPLSWPIMR